MKTIAQIISNSHVNLFAGSFVGMVLLMAGTPKLLDPDRFIKIVHGYQLLSGRMADRFGRLLPVLEILTGMALIANVFRLWAAVLAICLFVIFGGAIVVSLIRGRFYISCGCFGADDKQELSWIVMLRTAFLGGLAVLALPVFARTEGPRSNGEMILMLLIAGSALICWRLSHVILKVWRLPDLLGELQRSRTEFD